VFPDPKTGLYQMEWRENGRRLTRSLGHRDWTRAKKQADEAAAGFAVHEPNGKAEAEPEPLTLGSLFEIYGEEVTPTKGKRTRERDRVAMRMFLDFFGRDRDPVTFSQRDWDRFIQARRAGRAGRSGKPVGNRTIEWDLTFLMAVLNWAERSKDERGRPLLDRNPLKGLRKPREKNPARVVLTEDEYQALLAVSGQIGWRFHVALVLAHETGHRIGAIRQLRWTDIDFEGQEVRWRAEHEKTGHEHVTPLTDDALAALEEARRMGDGTGDAPVLPKGRCWAAVQTEFERLKAEGRVYWPKGGSGRPRIKQYQAERRGLVPMTLWPSDEVGDTQSSKKHLMEIFAEYDESDLRMHAPKPVELVRRIVEIATKNHGLILDSFAGTGTTGHAVIEANRRDGGNRQFILVEMEDYADSLTAERVRRVIGGYAFTGTQKTELLREKITWSKLRKSGKLAGAVEAIENLHRHEYDRIRRQVKNGQLIVSGETAITERIEGLGGSFSYCTLGDPVELDKLLTGETLPSWGGLGAALFHMATNRPIDPSLLREPDCYLGEADGQHLWLIYRDDLDWLKSPQAALTLNRAKAFAAEHPEHRHLVFAPARYVSQKMLDDKKIPVEFVPLPFALYRIDRS